MGFVESLRSIIYDILHNLDRIHVDLIKSNGLNPLRIRHDSGGLIEFRNDGKVYYNGTEIVTSSGGVSDHGGLTGLADDDHTQYLLINGTRAMSGNLLLGTNNITGVGALGFGAAPFITTTDAGEILFKALTTSMFGMTKTLNTSYVPLAMNGQTITDAAIAGTNTVSFTLDQDGAGASTVLNFNTGGTAALSQLDGTVTLDIPEFDRFYIDINGAAEYYFNEDELAMYGNKISGLGAGAANGDAIRYEQLIGQYLLLSGGTLSGNLLLGANNITGVGSLGFGAAPIITTTDAGEILFKALTTSMFGMTKTLNTSYVPLVTANHGTAATDEVVNVCYGTSATPPAASGTTEGALYIQYTA